MDDQTEVHPKTYGMRPLGEELTSTLRRYFPSPHLEVLTHDQNLQIALQLLRTSSTL